MSVLRVGEEDGMIGAIWAQSPEGIIGFDGKIPWHLSGDLKRFKRVTLGGAIVMGRKTWESIGSRPLPGRRNIIVSRTFRNYGGEVRDDWWACGVREACEMADMTGSRDIWIIGGAEIYAEAMRLVDIIDVTYVPASCVSKLKFHDKHVPVYAPTVDEAAFSPGPLWGHDDEPGLTRRTFVRRTLSEEPYELADNRRLQEQGSLRRKP